MRLSRANSADDLLDRQAELILPDDDAEVLVDTTAGFPYARGDYPWLDELHPKIFTPLSPPKFFRDHLGVSLYPKQEEDLLNIFGEDPKMTFADRLLEPSAAELPQQGILLWGKGSGKISS